MMWHFGNITRLLFLVKFRANYNKCIKKLFGYARSDSMSGILLELIVPTADTIVHNSHVLFASQIGQWFGNIAVQMVILFFMFF